MRLTTRPALLLAVFALAAAGCGGGSSGGGGSTGESGGGGGGGGREPAEAFTNACGQCHTLAAAETNGSFGPNLDELRPSASETLDAIRNGPGPMPDNLLEGDEAQAVADYVAESAGS